MKTVEQRLASLEKEISKIPRRGRDLPRAEEDLRNAALQYARMKSDGWYMNGSGRCLVGDDEREALEETFSSAMKLAALALLRELGIEEPK